MADYVQVWGDEMTIYGPSCGLGVGTPIPPPWTSADGAEPTSSEYSLHFKTTLVLRWVFSFSYFRCGLGTGVARRSDRHRQRSRLLIIFHSLCPRPEPNLNFQANSTTDVMLALAHL